MTEMTQIVGGGLLAMGIVKLSFDFINKQSMDKRLERLENLGLPRTPAAAGTV